MTIDEKFIKYCKRHKELIKNHAEFVPYMGGGMGVKMYLEARGVKVPPLVAKTFDFDFTFAVHKKLRLEDVPIQTAAMFSVMYPHVTGFVATLSGYTMKIASYEVNGPKTIPATGKIAYHVVQFKLKGPRDTEYKDFVDCTLAFVPGMSRSHLSHEYSLTYGLPIEKIQYLHRDVLIVLAGSFVYAGIKSRNPLGKNNPEKGLKNTARIKALNSLHKTSISNKVGSLVRAIDLKKMSKAKQTAVSIIRHISRTKGIQSPKGPSILPKSLKSKVTPILNKLTK